jgi:hypothetical protein
MLHSGAVVVNLRTTPLNFVRNGWYICSRRTVATSHKAPSANRKKKKHILLNPATCMYKFCIYIYTYINMYIDKLYPSYKLITHHWKSVSVSSSHPRFNQHPGALGCPGYRDLLLMVTSDEASPWRRLTRPGEWWMVQNSNVINPI